MPWRSATRSAAPAAGVNPGARPSGTTSIRDSGTRASRRTSRAVASETASTRSARERRRRPSHHRERSPSWLQPPSAHGIRSWTVATTGTGLRPGSASVVAWYTGGRNRPRSPSIAMASSMRPARPR